MTSLVDKVRAIHDALADSTVRHAFGGALALAFHISEPRATRDIDVNVFVPPSDVAVVFAALPTQVRHSAADVASVKRDGQVRLFWGETPVDLFFSTHAFHETAEVSVITVTLDGATIPILGATELAVFKAFFDRTKDWADIEAMLEVGSVDVQSALGWLVSLLGPDDLRVTALLERSRRSTPQPEPRFDP